jgi:hypothetical protein
MRRAGRVSKELAKEQTPLSQHNNYEMNGIGE